MTDLKIKYGVNQFINEVSIETLGETDLLKSPKYKYVIEFAEGKSHDGNGHQYMKIYTNGELEVLKSGNWKISPVIKMPFNWRGYYIDIEISDSQNKSATISGTPEDVSLFKKESFFADIKFAFDSVNELAFIDNTEHFEFLKKIKETERRVEIVKGIWKDSPVPFKTLYEIAEQIAVNISEFEKIKNLLRPESAKYLKSKLNSTIETFNGFKAEFLK